jgi:hypothetical protein
VIRQQGLEYTHAKQTLKYPWKGDCEMKVCLICGTFTVNNSRLCNRCGNEISADKTPCSAPSAVKTFLCPYHKGSYRGIGLVREWEKIEKSELWTYEEVETEYEQLECGHKIFLRKTGLCR